MLESALQLPGLDQALDSKTIAASQTISQLSTSEWLGPLAPIALSPFFGLAVLSGVATYGPEWLQSRSALFQEGGALDSPLLFWAMLSLAIFTSLPRFTKVSKPFSLAAEKLETYSAVIILIVVRLFGSQFQHDASAPSMAASTYVCAGFGTVSMNVIMAAFAALNVVVINFVKLFCELMVFFIPIPFIDGAVELGNKSLCAALMSLYCYNPWLATVLNLMLLTLAAFVFMYVYRRMNYLLDILAGPVLARLLPSWFAQQDEKFDAFVYGSPQGMPRYLPVTVQRDGANYLVNGRRRWRTFQWKLTPAAAEAPTAVFCECLRLRDETGGEYILHRRFRVSTDTLSVSCKV